MAGPTGPGAYHNVDPEEIGRRLRKARGVAWGTPPLSDRTDCVKHRSYHLLNKRPGPGARLSCFSPYPSA
jgi:hypothetical protein